MNILVEIFIKFPLEILNMNVVVADYKISLFDCITFGFMFGLFIWAVRNIFDF